MKNSKLATVTKIYTLLGKGIFTCAAAGLGLVLGGPLMALLGILVGSVGSELLEKSITRLIKFN